MERSVHIQVSQIVSAVSEIFNGPQNTTQNKDYSSHMLSARTLLISVSRGHLARQQRL